MSEVSVMLREFHQAFGVEGDRLEPGLPSESLARLRFDLLHEEFEEYREAAEAGDLVEVADALADIVYIAYGSARTYGVPLDRVLAEVHRSNMAKLVDGRVVRRADGKVLKPAGWVAPDVAGVLAAYGWDGE